MTKTIENLWIFAVSLLEAHIGTFCVSLLEAFINLTAENINIHTL